MARRARATEADAPPERLAYRVDELAQAFCHAVLRFAPSLFGVWPRLPMNHLPILIQNLH